MYQAKKYFKPNQMSGMTFDGWQVVDESGTAVPVIYEQKWDADEAAMSINCELGLESTPGDMRSESEILNKITQCKTWLFRESPMISYWTGYQDALLWVLKMD